MRTILRSQKELRSGVSLILLTKYARYPTQPSTERGNIHQERKEQLLGSLGRKIEAVNDLADLHDRFDEHADVQEVIALLDVKLQGIKSSFPVGVQEKYAQYQSILSQLQASKEDFEELGEREIICDTPLTSDENRRLDQYESLENESRQLLADQEVFFLREMDAGIKALKEKALRVQRETTEGTLIANALASISKEGEQLRESDIHEIIRHPFTVTLVIEKTAWSKTVFPKARGCYLNGTPYIFICESDVASVQKTLQHERKHAVLDGVQAVYSINPIRHLRSIQRISNTSESIAKDKLGNSQLPKKLLDMCQEEIVAALDSAKQKNFLSVGGENGSFFDFILKSEDQFESLDAQEKLEYTARTLATAGGHIFKAIKFLESWGSQVESEELRSLCLAVAEQFRNQYLQAIKLLRQNLAIARCLDSGTEREVDALAVILRPSQYHHIPEFLKYKYGAERVTTLERHRILLTTGEVLPSTFPALITDLESGSLKLNSLLLGRFTKLIEGSDLDFYRLDINSVTELVYYCQMVDRLGEILQQAGIMESTRVMRDALYRRYLSEVWGEWSKKYDTAPEKVNEVLSVLTPEEQPRLLEAIEFDIRDFLENEEVSETTKTALKQVVAKYGFTTS